MTNIGLSQRIYLIYNSLFFKVLVTVGLFISIYDIFKNIENISQTNIFSDLIMIVIPIIYFNSTQKNEIEQSWRYFMMWIVLISQIVLGIHTSMYS